MTTASGMRHCVRRRPVIASVLDRWFRLRRFERNGRVYAALGLVPVFTRMARLFGERLPQRDRLASSDLHQVRMRARYHELINMMSIMVQLPLASWAWSAGSTALTAYTLALLVPHMLSIMLERYKRAVCEVEPSSADVPPLVGAAPALGDAAPGEEVRQDRDSTRGPRQVGREAYVTATERDDVAPIAARGASCYFGPFTCETERLYTMLGVEAFRRFVLTLIRISTPPDASGASLRNVTGGRRGLTAFAAQTRTAELTHLFGTALHVPFAVAFARSGNVAGLAYVIFLLGLNIICALLQRQHRVRLAGLIHRARQRRMGSARYA